MSSNDIMGLVLLGLLLGVPILTVAFCIVVAAVSEAIKNLKG